MDDRNDNVVTGALLVMVGAILGAGAALLFAPRSGRETRRDISRFARKTSRKVEGVPGEYGELAPHSRTKYAPWGTPDSRYHVS